MPTFKLLLVCAEPGFMAGTGRTKLVFSGDSISALRNEIASQCGIGEDSFNLSFDDEDFGAVDLKDFVDVADKQKIEITRRKVTKRR
jgi:hypothetical protein